MITRRKLGLAALATTAAPALAQAPWPNRQLRMVIPWPPGQATDIVGRIAAHVLGERLGQNVVPDNKPGAGGQIGTDIVCKAAPDGYTLLSASIGPITFGPLVTRVPYDVERDLAPVLSFGPSPYMLLVKPDFPAQDARSFVALLRANPGKYSYASSGIGGAQHLLTAMFNARAGIDALHVPFTGSGPAMAAFLGGQVDYAIETVTGSSALVRQGSLKPLGQSLANPSPLLPGIPPLASAADLPGYDIGSWNGIMVPKATPQPIVQRLYTELKAGLENDELRQRFGSLGIALDPKDPAGFAKLMQDQWAIFRPLIQQLGIRAE